MGNISVEDMFKATYRPFFRELDLRCNKCKAWTRCKVQHNQESHAFFCTTCGKQNVAKIRR